MEKHITIIKLLTGEDLIANVTSTDSSSITVEEPLVIVTRQTSETQMSLGFIPFLPFKQKQVVINKSAVAVTAVPSDSLANEYNRMFSPIIQPTNTGIIVPE